MRELVKDRQAGDHIVFSCKLSQLGRRRQLFIPSQFLVSGHGEQTDPDKDQNEEDGQDESGYLSPSAPSKFDHSL